MIYGKGISKSSEIIDIAIELGLVMKSGSWFSYEGSKIAQGKDNARKYFEDNPELMKVLEEKIKERLANGETTENDELDFDADDFDLDSLNLD
jgi:recombination protein RecA